MARTGGIWLLPIRFTPVRGDILHKPAEPALNAPFICRSSSHDRENGRFPPFFAVFLRPDGGARPDRVTRPTRYLEWPKKALSGLMKRNPTIDVAMKSVFSIDLTRKLAGAT